MSDAVSDEKTFAQLDLDPRIIAAVTKLGFNAPTPIQAKAIPPLLAGRDLVGRARTGSGKTAAFGLPLVHKLSQKGAGVRAVVLAPTRELALQITAALRSYAVGLRLQMVTLYGGAAYHPQLKALHRGVDVVVGTPGRLIDHLERGSLDLSTVELAVIDEADEMLRMGFVDDVTKILQATPDTRQVALFSATMPAPIRRVAETYLSDPLEVQVEARRLVVEHIEQVRIDVPARHEIDTLVRVLKSKETGATLIFARTRVTCDELAESLRDRGFNARALHGDMSQAAREEVLGALRTHRLDLVVATDVAARGIDVEHLTHVINFDMPDEVEVYVNRIGRTGRAGRAGTAISLIKRRDVRLLRRIEEQLKTRIAPQPVPSDAQIVGRQRAELEVDLRAALEHQNTENAEALRELLQQGQWEAEELATAALGLLMQDRHLDIEAAPSQEPPQWARRPERRPKSPRPGKGRPVGPRGTRSPAPRGARDGAADQATLSASVGREQGIGPNDVVGALTNELGVPFQSIGRISVYGDNLTVGLSEEAAAGLLRKGKTVFLRGNAVTFTKPGDHASSRPSPRPVSRSGPGAAARRVRPAGDGAEGDSAEGGHRPPLAKKYRGSGKPRRDRIVGGPGPGSFGGQGESTGKPGGKGKAKPKKIRKGRQAPVRKGKNKNKGKRG